MPMHFLLNSQLSSQIGDTASTLPLCKELEAILDYNSIFLRIFPSDINGNFDFITNILNQLMLCLIKMMKQSKSFKLCFGISFDEAALNLTNN